ncbi:MAG: hypothetical protein LBR65_03980 [Culturomica sp.]|jgi:YD repeat-containing protein|nr:hypothetical protein [Culturomica sp.]
MKKTLLFCKTVLLLLCCTVFSRIACSQVVSGEDNVRLPAPQDWSFIRYGNVPVNPYTGTLSLTVPLYRYTDPDFDLEIAAGYAAEGFRPNQLAGILGLGWNLNAGGCVTREVRGISDGFSGWAGSNQFIAKGYGHYSREGRTDDLTAILNSDTAEIMYFLNHHSPNTSSDMFYRYVTRFIPFMYGDTIRNHNSLRYETRSDIYHFNFGKHKGSFILGPSGQVHVFDSKTPSGEYQVYLSIHPDSTDVHRIVIKTGDGYEYTFGGSPELQRHSTGFAAKTVPYYFGEESPKLSWPLTRILSPNGRTVFFDYSTAQPYYYCRPEIKDYQMQVFFTNESPPYSYQQFKLLHALANTSDISPRPNASCNYHSLLERIRIDNTIEIDFTYEERIPEKYRWIGPAGLRTDNLPSSPFLREIHVKQLAFTSYPTTLKTCRFDYHYASGNPVLFLDAITLSGEGKYAMDYHGAQSEFPHQGTVGIDIWGFYTNVDNFDLSRVYELDQSPNLGGTCKGMLSSLTYPTGGSTTFEYELHRCAHTLARNSDAPMFPFLIPCDEQILGGVRTRKITDYTATGQAASFREFFYESGGKSTGTSLSLPFYLINSMQPLSRSSTTEYQLQSGDLEIYHKSYSPDKHHIEYSSVRERHADGAEVEYHYSHYGNMPDVNEETRKIPDIREIEKSDWEDETQRIPLSFDEAFFSQYHQRKPFSRHTQRGKLLAKKFFNASGTLLRKETHVYDTTATLPFIEGMECDDESLYVFCTYTGDYPLVRSIRTDYSGTDSIETITDFSYNFRKQLTESTTTNSDGSVKTVKTTYLPPLGELSPGTWKYNMAGLNSTKYPLKREMLQGPSATEIRLLSMEETDYGQINALFKPLQIRQTAYDGPTPVTRDYAFKYNHSGNVVETITPEGRATSYVWGYGGLFLLAKVENATIPTLIDRVFSPFILGVYPLPESLTDTQKNALRGLPGALSTLFDHKPFIGVSCIETPDGNKTWYDYDTFGRLTRVSDPDQNPLRTLDYFIKNQ